MATLNKTALIIVLAVGMPLGLFAAGTWSSLNNAPPLGVNNCLLLSDGTVLAMNGAGQCERLTPDSRGSYVNGTWTTLATMNNSRMFFSSQVLTNGNIWVAGGEDGNGGSSSEWYNTLNNTWTLIPAPSGGYPDFSDSISEILPDGNPMVCPVYTTTTCLIYNVSSNSWQTAASCAASQDEADWVKLTGDNILTIDAFSQNSEHYIPSLNEWVADGGVPVQMYDSSLGELGTGHLLPNGKVFWLGSTTNTAIYTPGATVTSAGGWVAGPAMVFGTNQLGASDAPAAMMTSGKILCCLGPSATYNGPCYFYEYDYNANAFTRVSAPGGGSTYNSSAPFGTSMLDLPDGTVLFVGGQNSGSLYIYTPTNAPPLAVGQPVINSISESANGSYELAGTGLNGISEGAAYGDDEQMSCNYPLIRMTNNVTGNIYYARTYNWSSTSVMTGTNVLTTDFALPPNLPAGTYSLVVSAVGNPSAPVTFTYAPPAVPTGLTAVAGTNQAVLSWNAVSGATAYNIKQPMPGNPPYYGTVGTVTGTSFTNINLANLYTYSYVVTAVGPNGESGNSSPVTVTPFGPPAMPTGVSAVADTFGRITLNWMANPGFVSNYNIKRSATHSGPYTNLAVSLNPFYTDSGLAVGQTYYYVISTVNPYGESGNSAETSAVSENIANFNFESPSIGNHQYDPTNAGWTFSGASPNGSGLVANGSAFGNPSAPEGVQAAFVQSNGVISQVLSGFVPGQSYVLTYSAAERPGNSQTWNVQIDNTVIQSNKTPGGTSYTNYSATFTASAQVHMLSFIGTDIPGGDNTVFLDDVAIWPASPGYGDDFGFETPSISTYQYNPSGGSWAFSGVSPNGSGIVHNGSAFGNPSAPEGVQAAFVQGTGIISQTLTSLTPGQTYTIGYLAAQRSGGSQHGGQTWNVVIDGAVIQSNNTPGSTSYTPYSATFTATSSSHMLEFAGTDLLTGDNTVFIDNVVVGVALQPLPPPSITLGGVTNGALLNYQAIINLAANVTANGNNISYVQYLYDVTNLLASQLSVPPYTYAWNTVLMGSHNVFARVYFNNGSHQDSAAAAVNFFTTLPATVTDVVGSQETFVANLTSFTPVSYQWQKVSSGMTNNIAGATSATLTLTNLQLSDAASYQLQVTNANGIVYSPARPLTVNSEPSAVNNVVTAMASQTGSNTGDPFTPTWTLAANSLIAGQSPSGTNGNFDLEPYWGDRNVNSLTAGGSLTIATGGSPTTTSTNYVSCGNSSGAGSLVVYTLTNSSANGYNLTNITVYGGWRDAGRDQQGYTVYYSTVTAPASYILLGNVSYNPANAGGVACATRATWTAASGYLATNVAAVKFDFTTPTTPNGWCGYSEIQVFGVQNIPPAVATIISGVSQDSNGDLVMNLTGMVIGRTYEVQSTTNLVPPVAWNMETNFIATTTAISVTNAISARGQKFYRISGF